MSQLSVLRYQSNNVAGRSSGDVLTMLFDGCFRFLERAKTALESNRRAEAGHFIGRAHAIIEHFLATLDEAKYPELYASVGPVYLFCMQHLIQANIHQDPVRIADVVRIMTPIAEGFREAVVKSATPLARAGNE